MKRNKILASLLALSLSLGLTVPAFAAENKVVETTGEVTITVGTVLNLPTIKVTINDPSMVVVNPYKQTYTGSGSAAGLTGSDSLISKATGIKNESNVQVDISAKPTVTTDSQSLEIRTEPISDSDRTTKQLYMQLHMAPVAAESDIDSYDNTKSGTQSTVIKKDGASTPVVISLAALSGSTATYGAMRIMGDSCGSGWTTSDNITLSIVFDIQPHVGT